jgi:hypothetical protein
MAGGADRDDLSFRRLEPVNFAGFFVIPSVKTAGDCRGSGDDTAQFALSAFRSSLSVKLLI